MKKYIDSKIITLNNEDYLVYLKSVPVRETKQGRKEIIRAFVKKLKKKPKKIGIIRNYIRQFSYQPIFLFFFTNPIK